MRHFKTQHLVTCSTCGMVFTAWEPTAAELGDYYSNYPAVDNISPVTLLRYDELLNAFAAFRKHGRIMDVGCGGGHFLAQAKRKGWSVQGTEYGAKPLQACREKGIPVTEGALDPADHAPDHFDVICSFEVIEHVTDPVGEVGKMLQLLRPGGLLYLTTPNFNCLARRYAPDNWNVASYPEHLNYFTPRTMHHMLHDHRLKKRWLKTTGISIERWISKHKATPDLKAEAHRTQEEFRSKMETRWHLKLGKVLMNGALDVLSLGDSMKAAYQKPEKAHGKGV